MKGKKKLVIHVDKLTQINTLKKRFLECSYLLVIFIELKLSFF